MPRIQLTLAVHSSLSRMGQPCRSPALTCSWERESAKRSSATPRWQCLLPQGKIQPCGIRRQILTLQGCGVGNVWPIKFLQTWPTHSIPAWIWVWECEKLWAPLVVSMISFFPWKNQRQGYNLMWWSLCKMSLRPFPAQGHRIFNE